MQASPAARERVRRALAIAAGVGLALAILALSGTSAIGALVRVATGDAAPAAVTVPQSDAEQADVTIFWGDGCPNCAEQEIWLQDLERQYPDLTIDRLEVWGDAQNREVFAQTGERLGFTASSVPTTVIGERVWIGWTTSIEQDMAAAVARITDGGTPQPGVFGTAGAGACSEEAGVCTAEDGTAIDVPLVGEVRLSEHSLLVSTVIIGFVDGINPCSLWVLSILLAIVLRTKSRTRVLAIGTTFLSVTAIMYALYMAAFYSALAVVGMLGWIQLTVAAIAGVFGLVSVKDYFAFGRGPSFTIADSAKPGIYRRMREAAGHKRLLPALGATVVLAVGVSLLETPCSAGFPVLWTGMLHANGVGPVETVGLFAAYMVPFLIDELIVFGIAVATMRSTKLQDKHGELLKLIAGVTMLVLASVMVIDPTLMESPVAAVGLFAAAFAAAAVIHAITGRVRTARSTDAPPSEDSVVAASGDSTSR